MVTFSCREWAIHDNPYPKEQIVENSTRANLKLSELAKRKCIVWGLAKHKCASWFMRVVVLDYTLPCLLRTSVLEEQRNPLESRLIVVGLCHRFLELSEAGIGLLISFSIPGWSAKDTCCMLQLKSAVLSPTPSWSWLEVDGGWFFAWEVSCLYFQVWNWLPGSHLLFSIHLNCGRGTYKVRPMWWDRASANILHCSKIITKDNVELRWDVACPWIKDECNIRSMWGWTTNINAHSSSRLPFRNCSIPRLKPMI